MVVRRSVVTTRRSRAASATVCTAAPPRPGALDAAADVAVTDVMAHHSSQHCRRRAVVTLLFMTEPGPDRPSVHSSLCRRPRRRNLPGTMSYRILLSSVPCGYVQRLRSLSYSSAAAVSCRFRLLPATVLLTLTV